MLNFLSVATFTSHILQNNTVPTVEKTSLPKLFTNKFKRVRLLTSYLDIFIMKYKVINI